MVAEVETLDRNEGGADPAAAYGPGEAGGGCGPHEARIEDVQSSPDLRRMPIDKVGIKGIRHPVRVLDRSTGRQETVATFNMYVELPQDFKGTHMSRFVQILENHEYDITVSTFQRMLREMVALLEAEAGHIEMSFPYFVRKAAPVSGVVSLMDYEVTLMGSIRHGEVQLDMRVVVPVTSLCPCSKAISAYGAHNQRSHVTVRASTRALVWIEELIDVVEDEASCQLYGLLKRPDEKFVTEYAYDNPKFVEDLVRDVAGRLDRDARIERYSIEAENFESIHNHSAYARIDRPARSGP